MWLNFLKNFKLVCFCSFFALYNYDVAFFWSVLQFWLWHIRCRCLKAAICLPARARLACYRRLGWRIFDSTHSLRRWEVHGSCASVGRKVSYSYPLMVKTCSSFDYRRQHCNWTNFHFLQTELYLLQIKYGLACHHASHLLACCGSWRVSAPVSHLLRQPFLSMLCYTYKGPANICLAETRWLPSYFRLNRGPDFGLLFCNWSPMLMLMVWWKYYQNRHRCLPLSETYFGICHVTAKEIVAVRLFALYPSAYSS